MSECRLFLPSPRRTPTGGGTPSAFHLINGHFVALVIVLVVVFSDVLCESVYFSDDGKSGITGSKSKREVVDDTVQRYLETFGYMDGSPDGAFALRTEESVRAAIGDMQEFAGLAATGRLDAATVKLLQTKRCGLPDVVRQTSGRTRRYSVHGQKWPYNNLTWSLRSQNLNNLDIFEVRRVISKALDVWSRHSQLTFTEINSKRADILIYFYRGDHGDNFPFDGKGVILAHAFFPNGGSSTDVHFDADESWTTIPNGAEGTNLFNVAAHEFGHSLGLSHSSIEGALMYPWYKEMENGFDYELPEDDRLGIQNLYGSRTRQWGNIPPYYHPHHRTTPPTTTTTTTTTTTQRPYHHRPTRPTERPKSGHDPRHPDGVRPVHRNNHPNKPMHPNDKKPYYPTNPRDSDRRHPDRRYPTGERTTPGYGPEGRHHGGGGGDKEGRKVPPDTCDTSYDAVAVIRREVFIFKDAYFWRITEKGVRIAGHPAEITRFWKGLPRNLTRVDAVYESPGNKIVMFVDDRYYVFSGVSLDGGYPRPLTDLGLPATLRRIDGAMVWGHNGMTYLYSGSMYWRFDEDVRKVELDYPRDMSMWKGVGTDIDAVFQWIDGRTYFFKGKGFWKFNDMHMRVEHETQQPSAPFWMGCAKSMQLDVGQNAGQKLPYRELPSSGASSYKDISLVSLATTLAYYYLSVTNL